MRAALLVAVLLVLVACAERAPQQPGAPGLVEVQPMPDPPLPEELAPHVLPPDALLEDLAHPPVTTDMMTAVDRLRAASAGHPDAGEPEFSLDRTRVVLRWHGDVPDAVQAVVDDYASGPFTVVVEQTAFRPRDLQAEADRLFEVHPGVITAIGVRNTGDGIDLVILPEAVSAAGGLDEALADNGVVSRFPLFATEGSVVPAAG